MDETGKDQPYSPEAGSTLHDIKKTEELGRIEDEETEEQRTHDRLDREMYEELGSQEQELKELAMDFTHGDRVKDGQVSEEFVDKSASEVQNAAYAFWREKWRDEDRRPMAEVYSDFYRTVYPQYGAYLEQRQQADSQVKAEAVLDDFLQGADLTSK